MVSFKTLYITAFLVAILFYVLPIVQACQWFDQNNQRIIWESEDSAIIFNEGRHLKELNCQNESAILLLCPLTH